MLIKLKNYPVSTNHLRNKRRKFKQNSDKLQPIFKKRRHCQRKRNSSPKIKGSCFKTAWQKNRRLIRPLKKKGPNISKLMTKQQQLKQKRQNMSLLSLKLKKHCSSISYKNKTCWKILKQRIKSSRNNLIHCNSNLILTKNSSTRKKKLSDSSQTTSDN